MPAPGMRRVARPPDGGYGWVVVMASFLLQAVSGGIAFSVGVYFVEFLDAFKGGKGETAWVGSINTGLLFGGGPLASVLANRFGHKTVVVLGGLMASAGLLSSAFAPTVEVLYITYGLLTGLGFSFIYVPSVVIVGMYFDRRRNLAMGLAAAGFACGNFIFAPLLRLLILGFGWRGALIISSGLCLNCCVLGSMLCRHSLWSKKYDTVKSYETSHLDKIFNVSLLKDPRFVLFLANNVLWNIGSLILLVICTDYAFQKGISKNRGAVLVSAVGLGSLVGRVIVAFLANHPRCNRFYVFIVSTVISGIVISLYTVDDSFVFLVSCSATYGLFFGAQLGVLAVVTADLFGIERLTSAYGYLMFGNGAGAMMGPPIAGWVFDATHSYKASFVLGGTVTILSALILLAIPIIDRKRKTVDNLPHKYLTSEGTIVVNSVTSLQSDCKV